MGRGGGGPGSGWVGSVGVQEVVGSRGGGSRVGRGGGGPGSG